jgi:nucleotide-binding universal stress UspA family protein
MIRRILVGIDTSAYSRNAQAYAFHLARRFNAALTGLHVIDIVSIEGSFLHDISGSPELEPSLDFSTRLHEILTSTGLLGSTTESVARKSPRPLFVSPLRFREIRRALLAYDGSDRAARAMRAAAEFASTLAIPLVVITAASDQQRGERTLEVARSYLSPYAIQADFKLVKAHAHEAIVSSVNEFDAGLLFIGAYGHSRIREMVIGSNTEYVLRNVPCPVFLSR